MLVANGQHSFVFGSFVTSCFTCWLAFLLLPLIDAATLAMHLQQTRRHSRRLPASNRRHRVSPMRARVLEKPPPPLLARKSCCPWLRPTGRAARGRCGMHG